MVSPSALIEIGKRLRAAREALGRSLDELSAATRINRKFLQELESGRQPAIPDLYVRAFVKTLAGELALDPAELLDMMKEAAPPPPDESAAPSAPAAAVPAPSRRLRADAAAPAPVRADAERRAGPEAVRGQAKILVGLALLVVVGLIASVYWLRNEKSEKGVQEISFADVVKEQTAKHLPPDTTADSAAGAGVVRSAPAPARGDSLLLQAVTSESVWVHIEVDGAASEYTLPPGYTIQWKAATQFSISLGNPSGMTFMLNGKSLGRLAEGKKPLRNYVLSRASLGAQ